MRNRNVYVVWGPSPEWGDGVGVIGYATSKAWALAILREAEQEEKEYGPRSWRSIRECGGIEVVDAFELGWDRSVSLRRFVEKLNESI